MNIPKMLKDIQYPEKLYLILTFPVDTQRRFNVYKTYIRHRPRRIGLS